MFESGSVTIFSVTWEPPCEIGADKVKAGTAPRRRDDAIHDQDSRPLAKLRGRASTDPPNIVPPAPVGPDHPSPDGIDEPSPGIHRVFCRIESLFS